MASRQGAPRCWTWHRLPHASMLSHVVYHLSPVWEGRQQAPQRSETSIESTQRPIRLCRCWIFIDLLDSPSRFLDSKHFPVEDFSRNKAFDFTWCFRQNKDWCMMHVIQTKSSRETWIFHQELWVGSPRWAVLGRVLPWIENQWQAVELAQWNKEVQRRFKGYGILNPFASYLHLIIQYMYI